MTFALAEKMAVPDVTLPLGVAWISCYITDEGLPLFMFLGAENEHYPRRHDQQMSVVHHRRLDAQPICLSAHI